MAQNIDFSESDQIQTQQYPEIHLPSQETSEEVFQANQSIQNKECFENSSDEITVSNPNEEKEEPLQDSDIHQLIEECSTEICDEQKQSALKSKLLSINSQRLDKKEQEVKNVEEQLAELYDDDFEDIEYVEASLSDPEIVSVEEENVVQQEEEVVDFEDISQIQDERLINLVENDNSDSSNDPLLEEVDLFLSDNSIPPGIENVADDPEGDIRFLEELVINDSILSHESFDSNFEDNPSNLRPPLEPPVGNFDLEPEDNLSNLRPPPEPPDNNFDLEPEVISAVMEDIDEPDEHFNPGGEIFVSTNIEDDYSLKD
nr:hypothetical protein [Tanacetum cinerariifolium]